MDRYKKTAIILSLMSVLLSNSNAKNSEEHTEKSLKILAEKVKKLSFSELTALGTIIELNQDEGITKTKKVEEVLRLLKYLSQKEGEGTACSFCSAILSEKGTNTVEILDIAQDWIEIKIKKGDNLSFLAQKYYGNSSEYKLIADLNKEMLSNSTTIYEGKSLTIPRMESLKRRSKREDVSCKFCQALLADSSLDKKSILRKENIYIEIEVKEGDMLTALARKHYGKASLYYKIYEANKDKIGKHYVIYPGMILKIPELEE